MNLKDLIKVAAPVALNYFAPGIGQALLPGVNPFLQKALVSGVGSMALGSKPKDALLSAAIGAGTGFLGGQAAGQKPGQFSGSAYDTGPNAVLEIARKTGLTPAEAAKRLAEQSAKNIATTTDPIAKDTMSASLLRDMGMDEDSMLFKFMNSKLGEGVAAGLLAELLSEDEEAPQREFERRPFGQGGPGGQIGGINYKNGGEAYFPRRNGGIDPAEGSGTKDDVPALLLAGEFVHTRDANEGLGKMMGAKNKDEAARMGIQAQYKLMDAFERMA